MSSKPFSLTFFLALEIIDELSTEYTIFFLFVQLIVICFEIKKKKKIYN